MTEVELIDQGIIPNIDRFMNYWDGLTPEVRAKVWFHVSGVNCGVIGTSTSSMGEQAVADHLINVMSLETLVDMVRNEAQVKNGKA